MTEHSDHDRIVIIETKMELEEKALVLARELILAEHKLFKQTTDQHFDSVNNLQHKMDKQAESFASKDHLSRVTKTQYAISAVLALLQLLIFFIYLVVYKK